MATTELSRRDIPPTVARYSVWAFAIVLAVNQIGIASDLVDTLFTAVVAGLALALGLAFGLGARETAAEIVRELSLRIRGGSPKGFMALQDQCESTALLEPPHSADGREYCALWLELPTLKRDRTSPTITLIPPG